MDEQWEVLHDFPSYAISSLGKIVNIYRQTEMAQSQNQRGIQVVSLTNENHRQVTRSVPLLVAQTFVPGGTDIFNSPIHLDNDRSNCAADNLMWRPRWFAVKYHQQFRDVRFYHHFPLGIRGSRERFKGWAEACMKYGVLYRSVIDSYHNGVPVFPTGQIFRAIGW